MGHIIGSLKSRCYIWRLSAKTYHDRRNIMKIEYTNYLLNGGEQLLSLAMKNTICILILFAIIAAVAAVIVVKHEEHKRFEAQLRAAAEQRNKR